MFIGASLALLVTMCLAIARAVVGPSVYDRILAANMFGTKTVLFLAVVSFLSGRPDFLDLALAYALINFVSIVAVLQFVEHRARNRALEAQNPVVDEADKGAADGKAL